MEIDKLISAIKKLTPETKPTWGKMNATQMVWHCKKFIIFYQNEKNYPPNLRTKTLGYMHMFFLRHILKWDYDKYPKNTPTLKFFDPARAKDVDLEYEKKVQYKLVGEDEADLKSGKISIASPLARSLIGKDQDDVVELKMPSGTTEYEIIKVDYE